MLIFILLVIFTEFNIINYRGYKTKDKSWRITMAIRVDELNLIEIFKDLAQVCKTTKVCGTCEEEKCLVGYARNCATKCRLGKVTYVENGNQNIPYEDIKGGYDEFNSLYALAHLIRQCRSCKEDHYDNCIISVIRNCLELIEFGEEQSYEGIAFMYLKKLESVNPEKAQIIAQEYSKQIQNTDN